MSPLYKIIYFIIPIVLAGICNMVFVKLNVFNNLKIPIDAGKIFSDGERLFGKNKTWKGFSGMIFFTSFWVGIFGLLATNFTWFGEISLIPFSQSSIPHSEWFYGAVLGAGYVLLELPNSFIKRRLKIEPGKNIKGLMGLFFLFFDQADSVIGCIVAMLTFYIPSLYDAIAIFTIGVMVHYLTNIFLYLVKLKKQIG
jgi:CDP-diglyceride synthetase